MSFEDFLQKQSDKGKQDKWSVKKTSSLSKLIRALKNKVPPVKKGGLSGFFSTSLITSVEYAPEFINKNQLEKDLGLKQVEWLVAGQTQSTYMFGMDSEKLYCIHGSITPNPPSENAYKFHVSTKEVGGATFPIYAIPLAKIKKIQIKKNPSEADRLVFNLTNGKNLEFNYMPDYEGLHIGFLHTLFTELQTTLVRDDLLETVKQHEKLLEFDQTAEIYKKLEMDEEVIRIRKLKADLAAPKTEIHGDYVDDRDTIVKDSVISKSNIGAGGSSRMQELKDLTEMKKEGLIDDDEFKQMKKEILGK